MVLTMHKYCDSLQLLYVVLMGGGGQVYELILDNDVQNYKIGTPIFWR